MIVPADITGLVLAGGRGSRMGGVDKGLQLLRGRPLVEHALRRLAPQVATVAVSANRHLAVYESFSTSVLSDPFGDFAGPLAGVLAGLQRCRTPYLATVPCDTPHFPIDLVQRLGVALLAADAEIAIASTLEGGQTRAQPVFGLLRADLAPRLLFDLEHGERKVGQWMARQRTTTCTFADQAAFANINTLDDLRRLQAAG